MKNYSKDQVALIQLERAIQIFFEDKDYVSTISLAGASEDITKSMLEREGKKPSSEKLKVWFREKHPDIDVNNKFFYHHANLTRNFVKHFNNPQETHMDIGKREAAYWVTRAVMNYDWSHAILTKPLIEYIDWLVREIKNGNL